MLCALLQEILGGKSAFPLGSSLLALLLFTSGFIALVTSPPVRSLCVSMQQEWSREELRRGTGRMCFTGQTSLPSVLVWFWGCFCFVWFGLGLGFL